MVQLQTLSFRSIIAAAFFLLPALLPTSSKAETVKYSVEKIWDNGTYDAFTSIIKFKGKFYCSFREGEGHVFDENGKAEGRIRILCSKNGKKWQSVLLARMEGVDLRDPKLSVTPDGRLMVTVGGSVYRNKELKEQNTFVCFSTDGKDYTALQKTIFDGQDSHQNDWIWRVTWQGDMGYAVNYFYTKDQKRGLWLMRTKDGIHYEKHTDLNVPDFANESTVRFLPDGRMAIMVRRDAGNCLGWWGVSQAPFTDFTWKEMDMRLGGPDFLVLNDGTIIAGSRTHFTPSMTKFALFRGNPETGRFQEMFLLPSGRDCSYPGLLIEGNELWVCYYSAHESDRPNIYLAKLPLSIFRFTLKQGYL